MHRAILFGNIILGIAVILSLSNVSPTFAQDAEIIENQKFLTDVAKEYDENKLGFDVEYDLKGDLSNIVIVDSEQNSITFDYDSKGILEEDLIIYLPQKLIEKPFAVYIDNELEPNIVQGIFGNITKMTIPLYEDSKEITIVGVKVIPEFGSIVILILVLSIISIIILTSNNKFSIKLTS